MISLDALCFHSNPETVAQPQLRQLECRLIKTTNINALLVVMSEYVRLKTDPIARDNLSFSERTFADGHLQALCSDLSATRECKCLKAEQQLADCVTRVYGVQRIDPRPIGPILKACSGCTDFEVLQDHQT